MNADKRRFHGMPQDILTVLVFAVTLIGSARGGQFDDLTRLIGAKGEDYMQLRSALLSAHQTDWDVTAASSESWELGLAAFILNERAKDDEAFTKLDREVPRSYRHVDGYGRLSDSPVANLAFLLEKLWKAPCDPKDRACATPEWERKYAYNTLIGPSYAGTEQHSALWKAIWEGADDERLRFVVLGRVCADADPSMEPLIREYLLGKDDRRKGYCLAGLDQNKSQRAKDLVLEAWDTLRSQSYTPVIPSSSNPRARELAYEIALDADESLLTRRDTIGTLSKNPQPTDRAFLEKFFAKVESDRLKKEVLTYVAQWFPLDMYREPVRKILKTSSDPRMISVAATALIRGHKAPLPMRNVDTGEWEFNRRSTPVDALDVEAWQEDVALLEELATRDNLTDDLKMQIERGLIGMREARRQFDRK